jgi:AcrR family transcriptional regulator
MITRRIDGSNRANRTCPKLRKLSILNAGIEVSRKTGYQKATRDAIAKRAGISSSLIAHFFPKMKDLRRAIIKYAITIDEYSIIAQGIVNGDKAALKISDDTYKKVLQHLSLK